MTLSAALVTVAAAILPAEVQAVIDRSQQSRTDYQVTITAEVVRDGVITVEEDTETQEGPLHRVDVPAVRVLANCEGGWQVVYEVATGQYRPVSGSGACGIAVNSDPPISGRLVFSFEGEFGTSDVIELTGRKFWRRYTVTRDGIIVANDYIPIPGGETYRLRTLGARLVRGKPAAHLLTAEGLAKPTSVPGG